MSERGLDTGGFRLGYENGSEHDPTTLEWSGDARPEWLRLRYVKNGAGLFSIGDEPYEHWFDGLALLKQFDIGPEEIVFSSRFLDSEDYVESTRRNGIRYTEFATVPDRSLWERLWCTLNPNAQFGDNDSINLQVVDGDVLAIGDLPSGLEIDPGTLGTGGKVSMDKLLMMTSTPHPQRDDARKAWFNIGIGATLRGFGYHVFSVPDGSRRREPVVFIPRSKPAYMHSVGMSDRYIVVGEHPMYASLARFFTLGLRNKPVLDAFKWGPTDPLTLFIVDKADKTVAARVEAPARFYFHHTNVFEEGDDVVIDLCTYPDDRVIDELFLVRLRGPYGGETSQATLIRHRVNLPTGKLTLETLTDTSVEFPRTNPNHLHHAYRYTYAVGINSAVPNDHSNQLVKVDVASGDVKTWFEPGCYPNEPFMVPRPGATVEDDGVVLCVVLDAKIPSSQLLILDAHSFTEIGRARIPTVVPFGLHGQALPATGFRTDHTSGRVVA
jgi:carotenoid cleavage dioxygenase-like enzyme